MKEKKILFVCKYNRFRSKIAQAYFNKINKNKNYSAISAGLIKGKLITKLNINIAKQLGINIKNPPRGLDEKLLESKELEFIIIVANDVPKKIFKRFNKKLIVWKIPDKDKVDAEYTKNRIKQIINKINNFTRKKLK